MKYFILEKDKGIATLTINRPDRLNAFNWQMEDELYEAFDQVQQDNAIRVLVITGAGKAFSTGADIEDMLQESMERGGLTGKERYDSPLRGMVPAIAAINGIAIGAGMTLALQCDIRIASKQAKIAFPFVQVGALPEYASTYTLPRLVGLDRALELVLSGKTISAIEAERIGLVTRVVPSVDLMSETYKLAKAIAESPPLSVQMAKRGLYQGIEVHRVEQVEYEKLALGTLLKTEDHKEAINAFLEKRKPVFKGK